MASGQVWGVGSAVCSLYLLLGLIAIGMIADLVESILIPICKVWRLCTHTYTR